MRGALLASLLLAGSAAQGADARVDDIEVSGAWARPTPPALRVGAVYLSILNRGARPDQLTAVSTPQADQAEIHETREVAGVMQMHQVHFLDCPPGLSIKIEPGAIHIMLVGLKGPLALHSSFPLTLTFREAGSVTLNVPVEARE